MLRKKHGQKTFCINIQSWNVTKLITFLLDNNLEYQLGKFHFDDEIHVCIFPHSHHRNENTLIILQPFM